MVSPGNYAEQLRAARLVLGLRPQDVAERARIGSATYLDLESHSDEITTGIGADEVGRVLHVLNLAPTALFGEHRGYQAGPRSYPALASSIGLHLATTQLSAAEYSAAIGWNIEDALQQPSLFGAMSLDTLSDLCDSLALDWRQLLEGRSNT